MTRSLSTVHECRTPLADALISLTARTKSSFHALPISGGNSIRNSDLFAKYESLFGSSYLNNESTVTGSHFDSFFFGKRCIQEAEKMAAELFGADCTLYVTSGTTVCNQIAIDALHQEGTKVLLDKSCHQSMHFGLHRSRAQIDYLKSVVDCQQTGRTLWSLDEMLHMALRAQAEGTGYALIVLGAHSYDGLVYDIPRIIEHLLDHGAQTRRFLVDEAWGATNYFHDELAGMTAMAARRLALRYPGLNIVSTQSAHKSMSCLRQASMIHHCGDAAIGEQLNLSRFRLHTTSPSYPILASLDLARAQMQIEGAYLVSKASALAASFCDEIEMLESCGGKVHRNLMQMPSSPFPYVRPDPSKVSVNVGSLGMSTLEMRDRLFSRFGIYVNRITDSSMLMNFHIGISEKCVVRLVAALKDVIAAVDVVPQSSRSQKFIIPYPPGVPLIVPGEEITILVQEQIKDIRKSGAEIFYA